MKLHIVHLHIHNIEKNWVKREQAPTLLVSMEIVYVRPPDYACTKSRYGIFLNILHTMLSFCFFNTQS